MGHWLATPAAAKVFGHLKRFDARFWSVNFPRPMMASVVTTGPDSVRVDAVFYKADDLAGLIWEAEDRSDHPLLAYETDRDFRGCRLRFRWRSSGIKGLDAIDGPTLTIEGRDAAGQPKSWYVRLWNYATGAPDDATVAIDFANLAGGFLLPDEADPVWAGDIDRLFISLVPPGYSGEAASFSAPAEGWAEISGIACDGAGSVLAIGETLVPEHRLRMATGYDDLYHLTPARLLRNIVQLGSRNEINHYVGMSHYFRLEPLGSGFYVSLAGSALNISCAAWHRDFLARAHALGISVILSLSYELFDAHCWNDWKQRTEAGAPALTGWVPPSTLLSPAHAGAMNYLQAAGRAFAAIARDAGAAVRFQVGEPWWWVTGDGQICLYDDAAKAALGGHPVSIADVRQPLDAAQKDLLDQAGAQLAASTASLVAAVKAEVPSAESLLLVYLPTVLDGAEARRANIPIGWAAPAFDVLQLEDYDWVVAGNVGATARGIAEATERLGYPIEEQHYFAGFVLRPEDRAQWAAIAAAAEAAQKHGTGSVFVWALPQVLRDGFTWFDNKEEAMEAFHDVRFPVALGREASVEPSFSTAVVTTASGAEQRNSDWADARLRFDAGPGLRGEAELQALIAFFRARRGAAVAFRFEDPYDHSSHGMTGEPEADDQPIGVGDGLRTDFPLIKHYEDQVRRITRPVAGSVRVSVDGVEQVSGWILAAGGVVRFETPLPTGAVVRAGYRFDVPVRFAEDRLSVSRATFAAGEVPSVPLVEVREP
ncbi:DUF2460 domain-containing protein [Sphingosinicella sp. LY1275]|uniref:DUF2460 domain-containing protein n=1 Tax=Sphingosinicella sp. LY1275 TaxID=3095379 RepID=UPI002ADEB502|nr:DUF2460 domain-containing protein [Sphingosinicella sp. LY1275]MEA1014810.1 DUF2460 domain-containing protein [Sphingosinicella sp. LY1275]